MSKVSLRFLSLIKTIGKTEVVDIDKNFLIAQNSQEHISSKQTIWKEKFKIQQKKHVI